MILAADDEDCLAEVLIIAAALEVQDPRDRPPEKQEAADACHAQFADAELRFLRVPEAVGLLSPAAREALAKPVAEGLPAELPVLQPDARMARRPPPAETAGPRARLGRAGGEGTAALPPERRYAAIHRPC